MSGAVTPSEAQEAPPVFIVRFVGSDGDIVEGPGPMLAALCRLVADMADGDEDLIPPQGVSSTTAAPQPQQHSKPAAPSTPPAASHAAAHQHSVSDNRSSPTAAAIEPPSTGASIDVSSSPAAAGLSSVVSDAAMSPAASSGTAKPSEPLDVQPGAGADPSNVDQSTLPPAAQSDTITTAATAATTATTTARARAPPPVLELPVPVARGSVLRHLVRYCRARYGTPQMEIPCPLHAPVEDLADAVDVAFLTRLPAHTATPHDDVMELVHAAHFLNCGALTALMSAQIATWMMMMTVEEMRLLLGVKNDFTPQEAAMLRKELGLNS